MIGQSKINIVLIGSKHVGKTVYLSALGKCATVALKDAETIETLNRHWEILKGGGTPSATASTLKDMSLTYTDASHNVDISIADYDGRFAETLSRQGDSPEWEQLRDRIRRAEGFIVFMPADIRDLETMEALEAEIGCFINTIRDVESHSARINALLVVAVNKWDMAPSFQDGRDDAAARDFIQRTGLYRDMCAKLRNFFAQVEIIPLSAYGHRTTTDAPMPGRMAPWRVDEPVGRIVGRFFDNYARSIARLRDAGDRLGLARGLLLYRDQWQREPGLGFQALLDETLTDIHADMRRRLDECRTPGKFDRLRRELPEGEFEDHFSDSQKYEIESMRAHLARRAGIARMRLGAAAAALLFLGWAGWVWNACGTAYEQARSGAGGLTQQVADLDGFLKDYDGHPLLLGFWNEEMGAARAMLAEKRNGLKRDFDERLDALRREGDVCARRDAGRLLADSAARLADYLEPDALNLAKEVYDAADRLCSARLVAERSDSGDGDLAGSAESIADLSGPDADGVRRMLAGRKAEIAAAAVIAEFDAVPPARRDDPRYEDAESVLDRHAANRDPAVMERRSAFERDMSIRLGHVVLNRMAGLKGLDARAFERELSDLKGYIGRESAKYPLRQEDRADMASLMQEIVGRLDEEAIADICGDRIGSLQEYNDSFDNLSNANKLASECRIDGVFSYARSSRLTGMLRDKAGTLERYESVLSGGIGVTIGLHAAERNKLDITCRSMLPNNDEVFIEFESTYRTYRRTYRDSEFSCIQVDGGASSYLVFGRDTIRPGRSTIVIREENITGDSVCSAAVEISADEIISLFNGSSGSVTKDLGGSCLGLRLVLTR